MAVGSGSIRSLLCRTWVWFGQKKFSLIQTPNVWFPFTKVISQHSTLVKLYSYEFGRDKMAALWIPTGHKETTLKKREPVTKLKAWKCFIVVFSKTLKLLQEMSCVPEAMKHRWHILCPSLCRRSQQRENINKTRKWPVWRGNQQQNQTLINV